MPTTGLNSFDRAVHVANRWVASVAHAFGTDDRLFAYRVLRASAGAVAGRADAVETRATPMPDERLARVERGWSALNEAVLVHGLEPSPVQEPAAEGTKQAARRAPDSAVQWPVAAACPTAWSTGV
jgi:hypothetical protein